MNTTGAKSVALLLALFLWACGVETASATAIDCGVETPTPTAIDNRLNDRLAKYIVPAGIVDGGAALSLDQKADYALAVLKLWCTRTALEQEAAQGFVDDLCNEQNPIDPIGSNENVPIWFHVPRLARMFLDPAMNTKLTPENQANIKRVLWQFISPRCKLLIHANGTVWRTWFGENKSMVEKATCLLGSLALLPTDDGYDANLNDGKSIEAHLTAWKGHFYEYFRQRGREGLMCEIADGYNDITGGLWTIVRDMMDPAIGNEPELKKLADRAITLFWADYATDFRPTSRVRAIAGSRYYKNTIDAIGADPFRSLTWAYGWQPNQWVLDPLSGWTTKVCAGGTNANRLCWSDGDCPGSTCQSVPAQPVPGGSLLSNWMVSSYRPPVVLDSQGNPQDILKNVAVDENRPSYLSTSRRLGRGVPGGTLQFGPNHTSDVRRDLWYTPTYAMGGLTLKTDGALPGGTSYMDSGGPSLDRVFGLTFSNPAEPAARIVFYGSGDESGDDFAETCAGGGNVDQLCSMDSDCPGSTCEHDPQFWVGEREINSVSGARCLVAGRDPQSPDPEQPDPDWGVKLFISNGEPWNNLQTAWEEEWGWLFTKTTGPLGEVYVAIRICEGGYTTIPTYATNRVTESGHALHFNDPGSPVVIEVASGEEYGSSFEDFRTACILNWAVQDAVGQPAPYDPVTKKVDYLSLAGDHYEFWSNSPTPPRKNGADVLNPAKTYDSPYVNGDHGRDFVTIGDGATSMTLDFNFTAVPRRDDYQTVALWHMDAIAAGKITDDDAELVGRNRDLTLVNGPTVVTDATPSNGYRSTAFAKSLNLNGANYGTGGNWPSLNNMVIDFWFKPDRDIGFNQTLASASNIWELRLEGTNIRFFTWDAAGAVRSRTATGKGTKNIWHHIHAEISNVAGEMKLTVDGVAEPSATGNNMKTASAPIEVGNKSPTNRFFAGRIDDMKIRRWTDQ